MPLECRAVSTRIALLLVLVAAAVAFFAGYELAPQPEAPRAAPTRDYAPAANVQLEGVGAEAREILLDTDLLERTRKFAALLQKAGPESLDDIRDALASVFIDLGETDLILFAEWWARFDPEAAFDWAKETWQADQLSVVMAVLRNWARTDAPAALKAAQVANPRMRSLYTEACLAGWEESAEPGLLEFVEKQPEGHDRQRAIFVIARRKVLREGPEAAIAWAEGLAEDDPTFKLNVMRRVASSVAEVDPERAAEWAEEQLGGEFEAGVPQRVGTRWGKRDPESALQWLSTLPPGRAREDGVRETFRTWLRTDAPRAMEYMANVELEPWLDPAASLVARRLAAPDPLEALAWAARIEDEELRNYTTGVVARAWVINDEPAARAWVEQADLPAYLKKKIFEIPPSMRPGYRQKMREKAFEEVQSGSPESAAEDFGD